MKIQIAQYKAKTKDGHWIDDAIAVYTKLFNWNTPPYSHSEIIFPYDVALAEYIEKFQQGTAKIEPGHSIAFSSTSRVNGDKTIVGTRFDDAVDVLHNPIRWDIYEAEVTEEELKIMVDRAIRIEGRPYFYIGLFLDFCLPLETIGYLVGKQQGAWYCSQAVWYCLTGRRDRVSPRRLTTRILERGFKLQS